MLALIGAAALTAAAGTMTTSAATAHAASDSRLSVVHAVPKLPVDVYLDGKRVLNDFKPGQIAGPLTVPSGSHKLAITAADAKNDSKPAIGPVKVSLRAGGNYSAVAHLAANGKPTATLYENDISKIAAGHGRLTVRHDAAAPAVDILAGGKPVVQGLQNPDQKVLDLPAGTVQASVAAAGTTKPLIGPAPVNVTEGVNTIVYAWGSAEDDNLKLAVQTIPGLASAPGGVPAGEAGLVGAGSSTWIASGVLLAAAMAVLSIGRVARAKASR
ncbi:DUF4397 domain-containing protein [Microlunatus elymi]|uniref:DUF4397 domain-containing protein n=2 Tax=Microlunatus elymi TaxID=2596828 RepID=A0A516Q575_9ACTN|nr:DUF4397 domain-containing protein [Microlunatus elymi]